jgi:hypothetical protein
MTRSAPRRVGDDEALVIFQWCLTTDIGMGEANALNGRVPEHAAAAVSG